MGMEELFCPSCGELEGHKENCLRRPHPFIVRHYVSDEHPTIKGNGVEFHVAGMDRGEAEDLADSLSRLIGVVPMYRP